VANNNDEELLVVEQSRRALLFSAAAAAAAALTVGVTTTSPQTDSTSSTLLSVEDAIAWIDQNCDRRFLHAVVASDYRFMYRGVNSNEQKQNSAVVLKEESDLLLPGTYNDSNKAVNYFENLEQILKDDVVKPSNGHLATTSVKEASSWGMPASIWPLSDNAHYAWIQQGGVFYPPTPLALDRNQLIIDGKDCGRDSLEDALRGESWEIMFRADSYLAVPLAMEQALRRGLQNSFLV
jgi:hypothetical protein